MRIYSVTIETFDVDDQRWRHWSTENVSTIEGAEKAAKLAQNIAREELSGYKKLQRRHIRARSVELLASTI